MRDILRTWLVPASDIPVWLFYARALWVVVQLIAVYCLANQVSPFFYQRF
jgi:hypothetical protein